MYYGGTDTYSAYPAPHYDIGLAFPSLPDGHVELTQASQPAEYPSRANTLAWYHMDEGNTQPPSYPGEYASVDSTLAWYHFNEGSGTTTADVGGPVNDTGTLTGATWTTGLYGNGLSFDGNDQVTAANSTDLNSENGISIEAWVNPSVNKDNNYVAIKMTTGGSDYAYGLKINGGVIWAFIRNGGTLYWSQGGTVPLNTWSHIAMTYQVSASPTTVRLYLNGAEVPSYTLRNTIPANTPIATNSGPLNIGVIPVSSPTYYQGIMDELRIVGRALTAEEIAADGSKTEATSSVLDRAGTRIMARRIVALYGILAGSPMACSSMELAGVVNVPHSSTLNPQACYNHRGMGESVGYTGE